MKGEKMKNYREPKIEFAVVDEKDVITTSPGTETTPQDELDGDWRIGI